MKLNIHAVEFLAEIIWKRAEWDTGKTWNSIIDNLKSVRAASNDATVADVDFLIGLAEHRKPEAMSDNANMTFEQQFRLILDGDYGINAVELLQECWVDEEELA
jgi:hypothetical protein